MPVPLKAINLSVVQGLPVQITGAGKLSFLNIINSSGAVVYVQLFNAIAANVTLGTTVPDLEFQVGVGVQLNPPFPADGVYFSNGMCAAATLTDRGNAGAPNGVSLYFAV